MRRAVLLLAVVSAGFAPVPFAKPGPSGDDRRIRGEWVEVGRGLKSGRVASNTSWTFDGERLTIRDGGGAYLWRVALDPKSSPKGLDMRLRKPGEGAPGPELLAIYALDGDSLTVGYDPGDWLKRPRDLAACGNVQVFRRKRP